MKHLQLSTIITFCLYASISPTLLANEVTELDCLVKPEMYIDLSSPVDGVLESVLVKKSDLIQKGQELAKLESSIEQARVNLARQEAAIDNQIRANQIRYEFAKRKHKRLGDLYKKKAVSFHDKDEAKTEFDLAKRELLQAKLDKERAQLKLELAIAELNQKTIRSPITGIVIERHLMPGESVDDRPILQLAKVDPLLVEVVAPSELFGLIKTGSEVEIRPDSPSTTRSSPTVSVVDRIIDAASGSFSIRLALPNPDDKLIGGTKCIARFNIKTPKSDLVSSDPDIDFLSGHKPITP